MHTAEHLNTALAGRYEITREIGQGGMATVFLARDIKHNRSVALKVLSSELAAVLGRERFLAEIEVTANLHHPHLLPLFDSGEVEGLLFYVMPYIEGESLRARLERERQLSVEDAVRIASAIGSALAYAHRHGVIHRDLKPENVLLHEGEPLVMDFGIALAVSNAGGARVTQAGISLGTPAYMSPEQATGDRQIDARSDIYSLGALTYELLAGEPPHVGPTVQSIMAKVIGDRPRSLRTLRDTVPDNVEAAVMRALAKLPADRWSAAGDFVDAITGSKAIAVMGGGSASLAYTGVVKPLPIVPERPPIVTRRGLSVAAASIVLAAAGGAIGAISLSRHEPEPQSRFQIELPDSLSLISAHAPQVALSRDGSRAVFYIEGNAAGPLYTRRTGELQLDAIPGSDGALGAILSPDGKEAVYWLAPAPNAPPPASLMKLPIGGGAPVKIADSATGAGQASWGDDGQILFRRDDRLMLVSKDGGPVRLAATPDTARRQFALGWPYMLPGSKSALVTIQHGSAANPDSLYIGLVSLGNGKVEDFGIHGLSPHFASGHLLYVRQDGQLFARPFDVGKGKFTGEEWVVAKDVNLRSTGQPQIEFQRGLTDFSVSESGTIFFTDGGRAFANAGGPVRSIVVRRKFGSAPTEWLPVPRRMYEELRGSPDGSKLALTIRDSVESTRSDIWLLTFASGQLKPFTRNGKSSNPVWSSDGKRIVYRVTDPGGKPRLRFWSAPWDESGPAAPIAGLDGAEAVEFPEPGGKYIAIVRGDSTREASGLTNSDILIAPVDSPAAAMPFAATGIRERMPRFSPDGKWLAYVGIELPSTAGGNVSGQGSLLLRAVPGPGGVTPVSIESGNTPLWSRDGHTLFYFIGGGSAPFVAARIADGRGVESAARTEVFNRPAPGTGFGNPTALWQTDVLANGDVIYLTNGMPPAASNVVGGSTTAANGAAAAQPAGHLIAIVNWLGVERAAAPRK
jgi:serine/threonine-protein kinase